MKNNANMIFLIVGTFLIIIGLFAARMGGIKMIDAYRYSSKAMTTEGVITDIELERYGSGTETRTRRIANVDYVINGNKYESKINFKAGMLIGDEITIYYLPDEPQIASLGSRTDLLAGIFIFVVGGLVFIAAGIHFLNVIRKKTAIKKYVKQNGTMIYAEVIAVETDFSVSVQGGNPYSLLKCAVKDPETNKITATYNSWGVKNDNLGSYVGKQVKVYLDPQDKSKYYVDLEDLMGIGN